MLAYKDIRISTLVMLGFEAFSCFFILVLCLIVIGHHPAPDAAQFTSAGMSLSNLGMGVVVAIFSLVGFESSTAFGEESVNPLKTIPRIHHLEPGADGRVLHLRDATPRCSGTHGYKDSLDKIDAPLNVLADTYGVSFLSPLLSAGAMFSFFALASSCMNANARVMYAMGRHQFFHRSTGAAHEEHGTPHVALGVVAVVMFVVVTFCRYAFGFEVLDEFNDAGHDGRVRLPRRVLPHHSGGAGLHQEAQRAHGQGHRGLRGGDRPHAHPGGRKRVSRPGSAGAVFPVHLRWAIC